MHGNARSQPEQQNMLADKVADGPSLQKSHSQMKGGSPSDERKKHPSRAVIPSASIHPRQQREGYGFRPASGQTTPTGNGGPASLFSPLGLANTNGSSSRSNQDGSSTETDYRDEMDHRPDVRSMDQLWDNVSSELSNGSNGGIRAQIGTKALGAQEGRGIAGQEGHGIADEEGLGWPGEFSRTSLQDDTCAHVVKPSRRSFVCTQPHPKSPPTSPHYPRPSAPCSSVSERTLTERVFFAHPSDMPKP